MTPLCLHLTHPPLLPLHSLSTVPSTDSGLQFSRKLLYLESLNINSLKALSKNPDFRSSPLQTLLSVEQTLTSPAFNLPRSSLGRIFDMFPQLLTATPASLLPVSHFLLHDAALPYPLLPRAVTRCPRILVSDLDSQLLPALQFLRHRLGLSFSYTYSTRVLSTYLPYRRGCAGEDNTSAVRLQHKINMNTIVLLVSSVEHTLVPKLKFLRSLGFEEGEVVNMVQRSPALLTYSIEHNFTLKIRYFVDEMKGDLAEIKRFPQYFSFSLEGKIKPRHRLLVEHGLRMSLRDMLTVSDGEFDVRLLDMRLRRVHL